jgi:hypothetical protein
MVRAAAVAGGGPLPGDHCDGENGGASINGLRGVRRSC